MKKKRISKTSLLRILPAVFIGLFPFNLLEDYFLEQHYLLRGPLSPKVEVEVVVVDPENAEAPGEFAKKITELTITPQTACLSLLPPKLNAIMERGGWHCLNFDISDRYSLEDFDELIPLARNHFDIIGEGRGPPLLFGHRDVFTLTYLSELKSTSIAPLQGRIPVFLLGDPNPRIPIKTPMGKLERNEVALNVFTATMQDAFVQRFSRSGQWLFSAACALLVALVLYTYPVFFTLIFTLIFAASLWVASLFLFERSGLQLPIAASLFASATIYFLGMSDRLDKRERREWLLNQEGENLRRLDEMRNNFLSLVSHDLKTPIARMRANLERVLRGDFGALKPDQSGNLQRVLSASGELQRSISTLLLLSRIESRDLRLKREPIDLVEVLQTCLQGHDAEIQERGVVVESDFEPLFLIEIDRALILEVVNNLLGNALKYSPRDSKIRVRCGELDNCPELSPPQPGAWIEIQDEGPGIAVNERELVFKKFFQGQQTNVSGESVEVIKGTGLGLYLSSFFVREHGGVIQSFSRVPGETLRPGDPAGDYFSTGASDHGTVFRVTLPVEPPPESPEDNFSDLPSSPEQDGR